MTDSEPLSDPKGRNAADMLFHDPALVQEMVALLPRLRRFCYALTGKIDDGDDVAQACFERALRRQSQWQPGTRLDSWMFKIAQNIWIDQVRSRKVRGEQVDTEVLEMTAGSDGRADMEHRDTLARTREAVSALPEEQRVLVASILIDGQSYKDAAQTLGIPIGTVMSRLARARKSLELVVFGRGSAGASLEARS